jgi:hypothetical protein
MTDDFALVHQAITLKAAKNGGPSPGDILDLMFASHNDAERRDAALATEVRANRTELRASVAELTRAVGGRAEAIELAKNEVMTAVEQRASWPVLDRVVAEIRQSIADICRRAPRRASDPPEYDYSGIVMGRYAPPEDEQMGDIRRAWRTTTWLGKAIVGAVVVALVGLSLALVMQSYTIERAHIEPEPQPTVTVTVSPIP